MNIPCKFRPLGNGGLPPGYMRADFLEGTGTQSINTAVVKSGEYRAFCEYAGADVMQNSWWFGWRYTVNDAVYQNIFGFYHTSYLGRFTHNSTLGYILPLNYNQQGYIGTARNRLESTEVANRVVLNGNAVTLSTYAPNAVSNENPNNAPVRLWFPNGVKIYTFGIFNDTAKEIDYIPVLDPTGTPCMYDTVTRAPFYKEGSGQFIVGMTLQQVRRLKLPVTTTWAELALSLPWEAEFDEQAQAALHAAVDKGWLLTIQYAPIDLPEFAGYARADYLETTGYQWLQVDDLHLGSTSDVNMKFAPTDMTSWFNLFYCMIDSSYNRIGSIQYSRKIRYDYINQGYVYSSSELTGGSIYHVRQCGEHNFLNGIEQASNKASNFTIDAPTLIGKAAHSSALSHMRIFWFKAAANINVYAIPALDPNGTPCMFDLVSKTPYYDAGTSGVPFTVGLTKAQAETLVLGEKASGLTIAVPAETDLTLVEANNPGITIIIQTN